MNVVPYKKRARTTKKSKVFRVSKSRVPRGAGFKTEAIHTFQLTSLNNFSLNPTGGFQLGYSSTAGPVYGGYDMCIAANLINGNVFSVAGNAFQGFGQGQLNQAALKGLFEQYRIKRITYEFFYSSNSSTQGANTGSVSLPLIYAVIDRDDANRPSGLSQILGYASMMALQFGNSAGNRNGKQTMILDKPSTQASVETTGVVPGSVLGAIIASPWLSTDNDNVEHNGLKLFYDQISTSYASSAAPNYCIGTLTIVAKAIYQFKEVK